MWFWPVVVLLACVLAVWRVGDTRLDDRLGRGLATVALLAIVLAAAGHELHGRPTVSGWQVAELAAIVAFAGWAMWRLVLGRAGYFSYFAIAFVALWQGLTLVSTLVYGFVLIALPAFVARTATVLCLSSGAALLILVYRLAAAPRARNGAAAPAAEEDVSPPRSAARVPEPRAGR